ncbi:MAG: type II toxin-antitoxin system RelE/ParE family toxin [Oscillospiraceae bacterium]|jgi:mRNA interferase RelE/StbE|nr:type II toxin-antitoxin system RelE/ParE family toxin [Oscillospiraceae bacterium]
MTITFRKSAKKQLERLNNPVQGQICNAIYNLPKGNVIKLEGDTADYRLRIGKYRVIFAYETVDIILIKRVEPRGQVYKGGH